MLREATILEISARTVTVAGDHVMYLQHPEREWVRVGGEFINVPATRRVLPVRYLRSSGHSDTFFAIAPNLVEPIQFLANEELAECLSRELDEAKQEAGNLREEGNELCRQVVSAMGRIAWLEQEAADFRALPWWRRVWRALRNA